MTENYIEETLKKIREQTPNHSQYQIQKEREKTFTQKQWDYNMKQTKAKENLRKKSTRLKKREEIIVKSFDDLDRLLDIESQKAYTKKWNRLGKRFKINRLMDYYDKTMIEISKVYDSIDNKDVEYDDKKGVIIKINNNNIFNESK